MDGFDDRDAEGLPLAHLLAPVCGNETCDWDRCPIGWRCSRCGVSASPDSGIRPTFYRCHYPQEDRP